VTLYRTIRAGCAGILILAFYGALERQGAGSNILLPHTLHGWAWGHHWLQPCLDRLCHLVCQAEPGAQEERRDELWRHAQASAVDDDAP